MFLFRLLRLGLEALPFTAANSCACFRVSLILVGRPSSCSCCLLAHYTLHSEVDHLERF